MSRREVELLEKSTLVGKATLVVPKVLASISDDLHIRPSRITHT
jgi:hypothetical protein